MPGAPDLAFNQTAFNQHGATNSSSQSQKDHVAKSFGRALPNFAE